MYSQHHTRTHTHTHTHANTHTCTSTENTIQQRMHIHDCKYETDTLNKTTGMICYTLIYTQPNTVRWNEDPAWGQSETEREKRHRQQERESKVREKSYHLSISASQPTQQAMRIKVHILEYARSWWVCVCVCVRVYVCCACMCVFCVWMCVCEVSFCVSECTQFPVKVNINSCSYNSFVIS